MGERLCEFVQTATVESIDREQGIIRGVKLLGENSRNAPPNDNHYPRSTRAAAIPLLEGLRVCVDHPPRDAKDTRPYKDGMGIVRNVREAGDGLYADWHFPPKHHLAESVFWDAENCPHGPGFSINGTCGTSRRENGRKVIESIASLESIDLVSRPATTRGLREGQESFPMKKTLREWIETLRLSRPGYARGLQEQADSGVMNPGAPMEEPPPPAADEPADHEMALKQGFRGAIVAVLDDDSLDMKGKLSKIKEIMKAEEKLLGGGAEEGPAEEEGGGEGAPPFAAAAEESRKLRLENTGLRLLLESGVKPSKVLTKALSACVSEAEMKQLLEEMKETAPRAAGRPGAKSGAPPAPAPKLVEAVAIPTDGKALGKWLRE